MEQLHVLRVVNSMQKLYVVQRSNSKHLCEQKLINYKGVVSSVTVITTRTKDV